ncbi:hypothetical protein SBA4_4600001 [Candidatus Sulfopaludibacter sp. SbA4]|nr:hypothetical protein SBA4_4600001 [Candidatus Sulfopaludibacter sp. SbA4]
MIVLLGSGAGGLSGNDAEVPRDFYIVSIVTSDASPFWYHYILDVTADGPDSIVRYIRIAPFDSMCAEAITVKAATARLMGVSPSDLIPQNNMCAIDAASVNRDLRRRTRTADIDDSERFGIVATCGSRTVALHLPFPEQVKLERLRKTAPQLARWWDIQQSIKERAFGPKLGRCSTMSRLHRRSNFNAMGRASFQNSSQVILTPGFSRCVCQGKIAGPPHLATNCANM